MSTPVSVRHLIAGDALRRRREAVGFSRDAAADVLGWSRSKLSGFEAGQRGIHRAELLRALDEFGASKQEQETLSTIAADRSVWWWKYIGSLPRTYIDLAAVLTCAATITVYDSRQIPLLLQTQSYAQFSAAADRALGERARAALPVMLKDLQNEVVVSGDADIRFVIGEAALLNRVGDDDIMREQIAQLDTAADTPAVRILPLGAAPHPAFWTTSMTLLEFPEELEITSVIHLGGPRGGVFLLHADDVTSCACLLDELRGMALGGDAAARLLEKTASRS